MIRFENYKIESDGIQYILKEIVTRRKKGTEEEYEGEEVIGYYTQFESLIKALQKTMMLKKVRDNDLTLNEALQASEEAWKRIERELKRGEPDGTEK